MKNIIVGILLFGGFFFSKQLSANTIATDKMVFKVARSVFSLEDLAYTHSAMNNLKCMYSDSLLMRIFKDQFKKKYKKYLSYRQTFSSQDKKYYLQSVDFYKLLIYSRSQKVSVNENVEKFLYITAKRNKCSLSFFGKDKKFTSKFKELVSLEVFVRSRFLPTEKNNKTTKDDLNKAVLAAKNLLKSINRQIEEEVYW